jgi:hypothetical protein
LSERQQVSKIRVDDTIHTTDSGEWCGPWASFQKIVTKSKNVGRLNGKKKTQKTPQFLGV